MHRGHALVRPFLSLALFLLLLLAACAPAAPEEAGATATPAVEARDQQTATPLPRSDAERPRPTARRGPTMTPRPSATRVPTMAPLNLTPWPTFAPLASDSCYDQRISGRPDAPLTEIPPTATPIIIEEVDPLPKGYTVVNWFVGLGTGADLSQVEREVEVVDADLDLAAAIDALEHDLTAIFRAE